MKQWQALMAAEEKRTGLPTGLLASLVQQETGGQQRFVDNPGDFHYKAGPNGEKPKSTARGLGGILEGTARDPGYGVTPLKDWSVPEQLRFIADYSQARIKQAGSVEAGLAGYGQGAPYSKQVMARLGNAPVSNPSPLAMPDAQFAQLPMQAPVEAPVVVPENPVVAAPVMPPPEVMAQAVAAQPVAVAPDPWAAMKMAEAQQITPADMNYGGMPAPVQVAQAKGGPDFSSFLKPLRRMV